jgi:hypothetical protein
MGLRFAFGSRSKHARCLSVLLSERDTLKVEDAERLDEAIRAIEIARTPGLMFGFGGAHTILTSALDSMELIWNRYHPDDPIHRRPLDDIWFELWGIDARLAR